MNTKAIIKTAISYWSDENDCHIVESPLFDSIAGVGDTPEQAFAVFQTLLDDSYLAYLEGRVPGYDRPGRPSKGAVPVSFRLQADTKKQLKAFAKELGCSQGEIIDYLVFSQKIKELEKSQHHKFKKARKQKIS